MRTCNRAIIFIFGFMLILLVGKGAGASEKILFEKNSVYQYIQVVEDTTKKERYVRNQRRDVSQGGIYLNNPDRLLFEYVRMGFVALAFPEKEPHDALFVGLGAGSMPRYFGKHYPAAAIDIVEIDPDMLDVARKYFNFKDNDRMKVHIEDGRIYIKKSRKKYDLIVLDAYQNDHIPFHLTTVEFLREVKRKLNDGGVVVSNIMSAFSNKFFDSMVVTYKEVFPQLYIFKGKRTVNYIFVATSDNRKIDKETVLARAKHIEKLKRFDYDLVDMASRYEYYTAYEWKGAEILTDDFAPVNLFKYQKSEKR